MSEPFHIPMSRWCEHANERIAELESEVESLRQAADGDMKRLVAYGQKRIDELSAERDELKESNDTWTEVAREVCATLDIDGVLLAHAPEKIIALKSQLAWTGDRLRDRCHELEADLDAWLGKYNEVRAEVARLEWMLNEACRAMDDEFCQPDGSLLADLAARWEAHDE